MAPDSPAGTSASLLPRPPPAPVASRNRDWKATLRMLLGGAVVGFLCAMAGLNFGKWIATGPGSADADGAGPGGLALLLGLPLAWLLAVACHELGHIAGGKLVGGQFLLLVVGPFKWQRTPSGIRFSWNRSLNLGGGLSACLPRDDHDLPRRFAVMIAGGPLASVALAIAAALLAWSAYIPVPALLRWFAGLVAFLSAIIAAITLFPAEAGGFKTDGKRFLGLRKKDAAAAQEAALLALTVAPMRGLRPALFPPSVLSAATALRDGSAHALYGQLYVYQHHADRGEWNAAQSALDRVVDGEGALPGFMREMVRAEYAWLLAFAGGGAMAATARAWLDTAGRVEVDPATRWRATAAVLLAEGQAPAAREAIAAGRRALRNNSLSPVPNAFLVETLDALDRQAGSP